ncbi:MAG: methyltransferase domain-containing protein [Azospirillaceae bacterium]
MVTTASTPDWRPDAYGRHAGFVPELGRPVIDLLAPAAGERILDLGCGDGVLTAELAALGARVTGIDASPAMVEAARARGLDARVMDGATLDAAALTAGGPFDAVFSNAAIHWMGDLDGVARSAAAVLAPGGRFVGECGGQGNVAAIRVALHAVLARRGTDAAAVDPWVFPSPARWAKALEAAGFTVHIAELIPRPTPLPTNMAGWLGTFAEPFLSALDGEDRRLALAEAIALLAPALADETGAWTADYVRLRFRAVKG